MNDTQCPVAELAKLYETLLERLDLARDAADPRAFESAVNDALRAVRSVASHEVPVSSEGVRFMLVCIEIAAGDLQCRFNKREKAAASEAIDRMLKALAPQQEAAQAA
jgi:hypothetical protein